ncbi:MAG: STT3 domain-containing protein [Thermoanaerobaculia bacterium]
MRTLFDRTWILALWLVLVCSAGLALRAGPGLEKVFPPQGEPRVEFRETDPWYHLRAIEHQVANFPERFAHDPYLGYPGGGAVPVAPLFDWIAAATAIATAGGSPSALHVQRVAAWLPAILGALLAWPVALLARRIAGGLAAALAAPVAVLLPSQFLARSLIGFTDHHVLEVLLSTAFLVGLAGALDESGTPRQRLGSSLAAGFALGALFLTWVGTAALVLVVLFWMIVQFAGDLFAERTLDWTAQAVVPAMAVAAAIVVVLYDGVTVPQRNLLAALAAVAAAGSLVGTARWRARSAPPPRTVALALIGSAVAAALLALALVPSTRHLLRSELGHFLAPGLLTTTVFEAAPLSSLGPWWRVLWNELALPGYLALAALVVGLVRWVVPRWRADRPASLVLFWTFGLVLLTLRQNRFLYYLVVPAAVGAGVVVARLARRLPARSGLSPSVAAIAGRALLFAGVLVLLVGLGLRASLARAREPVLMSGDWREALLWLRASTPEPFDDAASYWRRPAASSYAVAAWWDYGYWILALGHRVPVADPTQRGAVAMANLLLAGNDDEAGALLDEAGARYLVLDAQLPLLIPPGSARPSGKFRSLARWAGADERRYVERVLRKDANGQLQPATLFHADYYRTLLARLYNYGGAGFEPRGPGYVAELAPLAGRQARELVRLHTLADHRAAAEFVSGRDPERFEIVGVDPMNSCVPIPPSSRFRLVHRSPGTTLTRGGERIAPVEIFEHVARSAG